MDDKYPKRKNHRLNYDYGSKGYYFVTVCINEKMKLLSSVGSAALGAPCPVELTELGKKVAECWYRMEQLDENVRIDKVVFMPNHIHGIIELTNEDWRDLPEKQYDFASGLRTEWNEPLAFCLATLLGEKNVAARL